MESIQIVVSPRSLYKEGFSVTCKACMLFMPPGVCGGGSSPFCLLLASLSFLEFRSMARLKVYVLWGKKRDTGIMKTQKCLVMPVPEMSTCPTRQVRSLGGGNPVASGLSMTHS